MQSTKIYPQIWKSFGLPVPVEEFRFHPFRMWRFDYCFVNKKIAIEIEGGIWLSSSGKKSRHFTGSGALADMDKYNAATEIGWRVLRYTPQKIDFEQIKRLYDNHLL